MDNNFIFSFSYENLNEHFKDSPQGDYLFCYLKNLNAKTCIVEKEYVDKDYLIDYQKFYCRSFEKHERFSKRVHFFNKDISEDSFQKSLEGDYGDLRESYLGFIVIKPIKDIYENPLIGRTLLKTYPLEEGEKKRFFVKEKYHASLFGVPLNIMSLPFQAQDQGVSACATIALWSSLQPLVYRYGIPSNSPVEITEVATLLPSPYRRFPSESGLTWGQMIKYIQSTGLDLEVIRATAETIPTAVKAYINTNLSLIALLVLKKPDAELVGHAAVISGYQIDEKGNLKELYVHDDQIGPYNRVKPVNGNFEFWDNEWIRNYGYSYVKLNTFLVPVYEKIRLTFSRIYRFLEKRKEELYNYLEKKKSEIKSSEFGLELYLYTIRKYKKYLLTCPIEEKIEILTMPLPRFVWVIRLFFKNQPLRDYIYDATSVYVRRLEIVKYQWV
ncbi:hypothetical protein C5S30_07210 [ANME-1 cluster archaeon GoMg4]|nr:hypothetical protein [ANME-1 cluster archaeon GoMg4]